MPNVTTLMTQKIMYMKAVIEFNLDEEEDSRRYEIMNSAESLVLAIWEYDQKLRSLYKYEGKEEAYEYRNLLQEHLSERNVSHLR